METMILIPARGGSKGIPKKNIKPLNGRPLIHYTIEIAQQLGNNSDICVSTDSKEIASVVESIGLPVPFLRPDQLATDTANSRDVILHALSYFANLGRHYERILLLQPTSPFRKIKDLNEMISFFTDDLDMVVSVKETKDNPYYSLFEENTSGYLELSKKGNFTRRQDVPKVYSYNGSAYVINANSIRDKDFALFNKVIKYEMDAIHSLDLDTKFDWMIAEMIAEKNLWGK